MLEILKAREVVMKWLALLFNIVWRVGVAIADWGKSADHPLYKKGSTLECLNYRGIILLSMVGKVHTRVINDKVKLKTAEKVML